MLKTDDAGLEQLAPTGPIDEAYWRKVRSQFVLNEQIAFFNTGTAGPASRFVIQAHERIDSEIARNPYDPFHFDEISATREQIADFVNASPEEVFFTHSTTDGMNVFAHGIDWRLGDEVLIAKHEHPGGYEAYQTLEKRQGIKIVWLDLPAPPEHPDQILEIYKRAITPKTRLIVVSHVLFVTGLLTPVKALTELAHSKGLLISVDGAQTLGVLPIDVKAYGFDHYAGSGQKWLLAGTGTGLTYISKDLQSRIWPLQGYDQIGAPHPHPILRYERAGQPNIPAWLGTGTATKVQLAIGRDNIEQRARQLSARVRSGLREIPGVRLYTSPDPRLSVALTTFSISGVTPEAVVQSLIEKDKIYIRTIVEDNITAVRASTHFYNTPDEVDHLLAAVRKLAAHA